MKLKIIAILAAVVLLAGCSKDVSYDTVFVLKPLSQELPSRPYTPLEGLQAFTYPVDTILWGVASYEDALAGVISLKSDPTQKMTTPEAVGTPYLDIEGAVGLVQLPVPAPVQMIVAVDPASKVYAYTQQEQLINLPRVVAVIRFLKWKEGRSYKDGLWSYYNNFYVPATKVVCSVSPQVQALENGKVDSITVSSQIKSYAYAVDTTQWRLSSYEDAIKGLITSKVNPAQTISSPDFTAYFSSTEKVWTLSATVSPLMVVVVDSSSRRYGYSQQVFAIPGDSVRFKPIVFRTWNTSKVLIEQGWTVVNDGPLPQATTKIIKR